MATNNFKFYHDPGHGWMEVPVSLLKRHNLIDKISHYSYYDPETRLVYLEEDCDAPLLINYLDNSKIYYKIIDKYIGDSSIRTMNSFDPSKIP